MKLKRDDVIIDGLKVHGRQRWEKELRAERGQGMQRTSSHVRGESPVQADPRAEGAQG